MSSVPKVKKITQDQNSEAWQKLCEYIEIVAKEERKEFNPREAIGDELFYQIEVLPKSISKLKKVEKMSIYGSRLKQIPPEIEEMESLKSFVPYTSYNLKWFPYEIINCKMLKESTVSTRTLYGNYKLRLKFPDLQKDIIEYYDSETIKCSICKKEMNYSETDQYWVSLNIGTDVLPLLANVCSEDCKSKIAQPAKAYIQVPHKGGKFLKQPTYRDWENEYIVFDDSVEIEENNDYRFSTFIGNFLKK